MKKAGDLLSVLFDEQFVKKAQGFSTLFDSWVDITAKNGIASASAHSRIRDLDRGILLVEMDHPGWKQILQTKQSKLLSDFRYRFPELEISGISLVLGKAEPQEEQDDVPKNLTQGAQRKEEDAEKKEREFKEEYSTKSVSSKNIEEIKDEEFKEKLKKLGQTIAAREKG